MTARYGSLPVSSVHRTGGITYAEQIAVQYRPNVAHNQDQADITAPSNLTVSTVGLTGLKDFGDGAAAGTETRVWTGLYQLVASNGHVEQLQFRMTMNALATVPAHEARCMLEGSVFAAS